MIDWTNTHFRMLMRILAPNALLYTEMQTTGAVFNNPKRALFFDKREEPIALQLGGSCPQALSTAAQMGQDAGFQEINLNLGCPSDRVQAGSFGACLMQKPKEVDACIRAMKKAVTIPVTAKLRIGVDNQDSYAFFADFVRVLVAAGCDGFIIHARKAWLQGLSPKQNRTIPAINYDFVYQIKAELPQYPMIINGNITELDAIQHHIEKVDGVMLGRLCCDNPYALALIHKGLYPDCPVPSRSQAIAFYLDYARRQQLMGQPLSVLLKPLYQMAHGLPFAKNWKQQLLSAKQSGNLSDLLLTSIEEVGTWVYT